MKDKQLHKIMDENKTGVELIAIERKRQIGKEGWTPEHDDTHHTGDLATAGACYALAERSRSHLETNDPPMIWPWDEDWWKPTPDDRIKELVKAGALIAAEIDRLLRLEKQKSQ